MAQASLSNSGPRPDVPPLPGVRLELRHGPAPPTFHDVPDAGFLIASVPGCDLRLPGTGLPPVVCLISRRPNGVTLRKLAPVLAVHVNGRPASVAPLADGDVVAVGGVELIVSVAGVPDAARRHSAEELEAWARDLSARQKRLEEQVEELEADRILWYRRREEMEEDCRRQQETVSLIVRKMHQVEEDLATARVGLEQREAALRQRGEEMDRQREELVRVRKELTGLRQQLHERYRERRDRLAGLQEAVKHAARKLQERRRQFDDEMARTAALHQNESGRGADLDARAAELDRERQQLDGERQAIAAETEELARRQRLCHEQERRSADERQALEKSQAQHQADLVQLVRMEATLQQRHKGLKESAKEVDRRFEQMQRVSRELEEQALELDAWHSRLTADAERLARQKEEQDAKGAEVAQRLATLEGQQATLAALRSRLERTREELRRDEQQLAEQRSRHEAAERDLEEQTREAQRLQAEIEAERQLNEQERSDFEARQAALEAATAELRQARDALAAEQEQLRQRQDALDAAASEQAEQAALTKARTEQVRQLQQRLEADRQSLAEREARLVQAEQALAALQEQVRRRSDEVATRQRTLAEQAAAQEKQHAEAEQRRQQVEAQAAELDGRCARVDERARELELREETLFRHVGEVKQGGAELVGLRQALADDRVRWETERQAAVADLDRQRADVATARQEVEELRKELPELELRAKAAAERLAQGREQLREHLAEVHAYAGQSRDDLERLLAEVQAEAERVRRQEAALHRARDEHRLAVAAYRQQLIDWQGQVAEVRRALAHDETRLERRQAEVEETTVRLAQQAEDLQQQQRQVAERRGEVQRHLDDMREWYRRKLRELASGGDTETRGHGDTAPEPEETPSVAASPRLLVPVSEYDEGDRQLGDLLRALELVDADTLAALLAEARRQRRSLRQLLLSGGHLTLYQMALIEAGNVDGLVLGPVRVVDRLRCTPREVVYRVFDPRRGQEALLRHLSEAEADDPVRPDEFRQRFAAAAAVRHPHVAATLEVLDVAGRPAVLQEWLSGLPSTEWPALAAVPGVWFRLVCQAALGLHTAHQAGLVHGHLTLGLVVLTAEGTLKLCGFGEPAWLLDTPAPEADAAGDLLALGRIASAWAALAGADGGDTRRKAARPKPLPEALQAVLHRLTTDRAGERYAGAGELLEELDRAGADVPANAAAWERMLRYVGEQAAHGGLRLSA